MPPTPDSILENLILDRGAEIRPGDLLAYETVSRVHDDSQQRQAQTQTWLFQQSSERNLRKWYATTFLFLVTVQIIFGIVALILIGYDYVAFDHRTVTVFYSSSATEIIGMTWIVTRYLFKSPNA